MPRHAYPPVRAIAISLAAGTSYQEIAERWGFKTGKAIQHYAQRAYCSAIWEEVGQAAYEKWFDSILAEAGKEHIDDWIDQALITRYARGHDSGCTGYGQWRYCPYCGVTL